MGILEWTTVRGCDPARFAALGAALLERAEREPDAPPLLVVAEFASEAILLGRHQRAASVLERERVAAAGIPVHRRCGGGVALQVGEGAIGLYLALPRIDALLSRSVGADRLINRYVRGLLAGLTAMTGEHRALYFGRDYVSGAGRQLAAVSQDGTSGGAALFEAIVGVRRTTRLDPALGGYPPPAQPELVPPGPVELAALWKQPRDFEAIAGALVEGYARTHEVRAARRDEVVAAGAAVDPRVWEAEAGWEESGVADIPIGFAEGLVRHDGERVVEARLRGDFIAPAFVLRGLEASLAGVPLDFEAIGERVDAAFRQPGAAILGLRSLRVFADAILAAAGRL